MNGTCAIMITVIMTGMLVYADPVLPSTSLKNMRSDHACLFVCNICFDGMISEMLTCANEMCPKAGKIGFELLYLWIGYRCKNFDGLKPYLETGSMKAE